MTTEATKPEQPDFTAAQMGAFAHLYRGEIYRSTIWRTRLDTTTNWSVVTLGVALSIAYSSPTASPLPLILVGVLIFLFLMIEARRYRYFNVWRARCRWIENNFYVPMLNPEAPAKHDWRAVLADDYDKPSYHVSFVTALGRRVRRNYLWIISIQAIAFSGKLLVHPTPVESVAQLFERAQVGPIGGHIILLVGAFYVSTLGALALWSAITDGSKWRARNGPGGGMT